jgi:hypothetical protein
VIWTLRQVYQYMMMELFKTVYTSITQLIQEVSAKLVQGAEELFLQKSNLSAEQLEKALQLSSIIANAICSTTQFFGKYHYFSVV